MGGSMIRTYVLALSSLVAVAVVVSSCASSDGAQEGEARIGEAREAVVPPPPFLQCGSAFTVTDAGLCTASGPNTILPHTTTSPATCTQSPPGPYPVGVTSVNLTCTAADGTTATCHERVHVTDANPPIVTCPADQTTDCDGKLGAGVQASAVMKCDGMSVEVTCALPLDGTFSDGTVDTCSAANPDNGASASCSFTVHAQGAPVVTPVTGSNELWPPNHKYQTIEISDCVASVTECGRDVTGSVTWSIKRVTSDEVEDAPGNGENGDGHTCDDMVIAANGQSVQLRAERDGTSNGRVYTIHYTVTGSTDDHTCRVVVPHDQSAGALPVPNDGCAFCVGTGCGTCSTGSPGCG